MASVHLEGRRDRRYDLVAADLADRCYRALRQVDRVQSGASLALHLQGDDADILVLARDDVETGIGCGFHAQTSYCVQNAVIRRDLRKQNVQGMVDVVEHCYLSPGDIVRVGAGRYVRIFAFVRVGCREYEGLVHYIGTVGRVCTQVLLRVIRDPYSVRHRIKVETVTCNTG